MGAVSSGDQRPTATQSAEPNSSLLSKVTSTALRGQDRFLGVAVGSIAGTVLLSRFYKSWPVIVILGFAWELFTLCHYYGRQVVRRDSISFDRLLASICSQMQNAPKLCIGFLDRAARHSLVDPGLP